MLNGTADKPTPVQVVDAVEASSYARALGMGCALLARVWPLLAVLLALFEAARDEGQT